MTQVGLAIAVTIALIGIIWFGIAMSPDEAQTSEDGAPVKVSTAHETWRIWGFVLTFCGIAGFTFAMFMKITVESYTPPSIVGSGGTSDIVNLGLMFDKGTVIATSLTALGLGVFCLAVSSILLAIRSTSAPSA